MNSLIESHIALVQHPNCVRVFPVLYDGVNAKTGDHHLEMEERNEMGKLALACETAGFVCWPEGGAYTYVIETSKSRLAIYKLRELMNVAIKYLGSHDQRLEF